MLCRVEMPYHEQIYARFYRYKLFHKGSQANIKSTVVLLLFLTVSIVFLSLWIGNSIIFLLTMLVFALWFFYLLYWRPLSQFRALPNAAMQTEITLFTANGLSRKVTNENGSTTETNSLSYHGLVKAVETKQDFYLFYGETKAYLIDKQYFTNGDAETLRKLLLESMGNSFTGRAS